MKPGIVSLVALGVLGACSAAWGGWTYVAPVAAPAPVVSYYLPPAPAYVYPPSPVVVYRRPVVAVPAPVVAAPIALPLVYSYPAAVVYPRTAVIRTKVYYRGEPVRNAVRAVLP